MCLRRSGYLQVSPGFCLLVTWFGAVNGWYLLVVVLGAALIHELGHWAVLRLLGAEIHEVRVSILGAAMKIDSTRLTYGRELAATLAGPAANFLAALVLTTLKEEMVAGAHLALGIFNLLPIRPLDGGRAMYLTATWIFGPEAGERLTRRASILTAGGVVILLMWLMGATEGSLWLTPAAVGLMTAAWREGFHQ